MNSPPPSRFLAPRSVLFAPGGVKPRRLHQTRGTAATDASGRAARRAVTKKPAQRGFFSRSGDFAAAPHATHFDLAVGTLAASNLGLVPGVIPGSTTTLFASG